MKFRDHRNYRRNIIFAMICEKHIDSSSQHWIRVLFFRNVSISLKFISVTVRSNMAAPILIGTGTRTPFPLWYIRVKHSHGPAHTLSSAYKEISYLDTHGGSYEKPKALWDERSEDAHEGHHQEAHHFKWLSRHEVYDRYVYHTEHNLQTEQPNHKYNTYIHKKNKERLSYPSECWTTVKKPWKLIVGLWTACLLPWPNTSI